MKEIKKILCAVDLAEYSAQVAEYAALRRAELFFFQDNINA